MELSRIAEQDDTSVQQVPDSEPSETEALETEPTKPARKTKSRVILNFWLDVTLLVTAVCISCLSAVLHIAFPAPTAADGWMLWGLSFDQWRDIQSTALCIFGLLALEHIVLHWNWVCSTIATRIFRVRQRPDEGAQAIYGVGSFIAIMLLILGCVVAAILCVQQPEAISFRR